MASCIPGSSYRAKSKETSSSETLSPRFLTSSVSNDVSWMLKGGAALPNELMMRTRFGPAAIALRDAAITPTATIPRRPKAQAFAMAFCFIGGRCLKRGEQSGLEVQRVSLEALGRIHLGRAKVKCLGRIRRVIEAESKINSGPEICQVTESRRPRFGFSVGSGGIESIQVIDQIGTVHLIIRHQREKVLRPGRKRSLQIHSSLVVLSDRRCLWTPIHDRVISVEAAITRLGCVRRRLPDLLICQQIEAAVSLPRRTDGARDQSAIRDGFREVVKRRIIIDSAKAEPAIARVRRRVLLVSEFVDEELAGARSPHLHRRAVIRRVHVPVETSRIQGVGGKNGIPR